MLFFTLVAVTAAAGLYLTSEHELVEIIFAAVADAYIQVSTFVAGTFLLIYGAEKFLKVDAVAALRRDGASVRKRGSPHSRPRATAIVGRLLYPTRK